MGLFQNKKQGNRTPEEVAAAEQHFFEENFREELRNHGRLYFERVIKQNGVLFKQDLDTTVEQINIQLKEHVTKQVDAAISQVNVELKDNVAKQLNEQFVEYNKSMKAAQDSALQSLTTSSQGLQDQYQELRTMLQKNVADQKVTLTNVFEENKVRIAEMKQAQDLALQSLNDSAAALKEQQAKLNETLEKNVADQQEILVGVFQENMAQIIEHYLLGALGDQYDLKAQLPSIIRQMEANKQAIVDDMKL